MDGRKRPTETRSRGSSPASQRRRQCEQSSTADKYANMMHSRLPSSLPSSRKNSAGDLPVNMRTAMSPMSNGSGSNTPTQVAPEVPSMLPVTQTSKTNYNSPAEAVNMETINMLRAKKAHIASNTPQGSDSATGLEVRMLRAQLKVSQLNETKFQARFKQLEGRIKQLEDEGSALDSSKQLADTNDLVSLREDIKNIKEQLLVRDDAVEAMVKTAMQNEIEKMSAFRTEYTKSLESMSTNLQAYQKVCDDIDKRNLPGQLQALQAKVTKADNKNSQTYKKVTTLEENLELVRKDNDGIYNDVCDYIGPIKKSYASTNKTTILQRIDSLETKSKSLQKEQDRLSEEQDKLSIKVNKLPPSPTESISTRLSDVESAVGSLGEDTQRLANRVDVLQAVPVTSALAAPLIDENQLKKVVDSLEKSMSDSIRTISDEKDTLVDQQKELQIKQTILIKEQKRISKTLDGLEGRLIASESVIDQVKPLQSEQANLLNDQNKLHDRIRKLERSLKLEVASKPDIGSNDVELGPVVSKVESFQQSLQSIEDRIWGEMGLAQIIDNVQDDTTNMELQIHHNTRDIELCRSNFVAIFNQHFDPFKTLVEEQLQTLGQTTSQNSEFLVKLEEQVAEQHIASPAPGATPAEVAMLNNVAQDVVTLKQSSGNFQNFVKAAFGRQDVLVQKLNDQVALKQDALSATQATDTVKAAIRNLQNQYNNITTDDLHRKMVHWFLQQYPSSPAHLVQDFADLRHEVAGLRDSTSQTNWDSQQIRTLNALAQLGPQLQALVQFPSASNDPSRALTKNDDARVVDDEALATVTQTLAEAQEQIERLSRAVESLQTSMHALNSSNTPFVRSDSFAVLQQSLDNLRTQVEKGFEKLDKFVTPTNEVLIHRLPSLFIATGQLQDLTESLNQNLPKGPLEFEWYYDFNAELSALPAPESDVSHAAAHEGTNMQ